MLGMAPLTGIPLTFISQGGSAMLFSLLSAGILLNISKHSTARQSEYGRAVGRVKMDSTRHDSAESDARHAN